MNVAVGRSKWSATLTVVSAMAILALRAPVAVAQSPINEWCPVLTEETADPNITTVYRGKTIAFCCDKCRAKFEADPERYATHLDALAGTETDLRAGDRPDHEDQHVGHEHADADRHEASESAPEEAGHEPHHGDGPVHGLGRLIAWLGKFHPAVVHFPIAMLVGAAVAELLLMVSGWTMFNDAGRFCLWFGAIGALVAAVLGWCFGGFHLTDSRWIMTTHRWLGTCTAASSIVMLIMGERSRRQERTKGRTAYRVVLFAGAALVSATGFLGGALIYGLNHFRW